MLYGIEGNLVGVESGGIIVECGGLSYKCFTDSCTFKEAENKIGTRIKLFTKLIIKEDMVELYGFTSKDKLECFKILTSVSGVGSKVAVAILSEFSPQDVFCFIANDDSKSLTRAQGVGTKLAKRVILELKDKIKNRVEFENSVTVNETGVKNNISEAANALTALGYTYDVIMPYLLKLDGSLPVESLIKEFLKSVN